MGRLTGRVERAIDYTVTAAIGNRINTAGLTAVVAGMTLLFSGVTDEKPLMTAAAFALVQGGSTLAGSTFGGISTFKHYCRTRKHIEENDGMLAPRYIETLIKNSENGRFIGYCQLQGAYLAARDTGNLAVFEDVRKQYSRVKLPVC